jgi:hypothetical protein
MIDAESLLFSEIEFFYTSWVGENINICGEGNCFSGLAGFTLFFDLCAGPLPQ